MEPCRTPSYDSSLRSAASISAACRSIDDYALPSVQPWLINDFLDHPHLAFGSLEDSAPAFAEFLAALLCNNLTADDRAVLLSAKQVTSDGGSLSATRPPNRSPSRRPPHDNSIARTLADWIAAVGLPHVLHVTTCTCATRAEQVPKLDNQNVAHFCPPKKRAVTRSRTVRRLVLGQRPAVLSPSTTRMADDTPLAVRQLATMAVP